MAIMRSSSRKYINKNGKIEKKHIINKMKNKEFKYTFILVMVFMVAFVIIGYNALKFDNNLLLNDIKNIKVAENVSSSSQTILLTDNDVMKDEEGLSSYVYKINVKNDTSNAVSYQLNLVKDENVLSICDCGNKQLNSNQIKYSLNDGRVKVLNNDMLIKDINLENGEAENILVRVWVDSENENVETGSHFHGHFVLNEIKK